MNTQYIFKKAESMNTPKLKLIEGGTSVTIAKTENPHFNYDGVNTNFMNHKPSLEFFKSFLINKSVNEENRNIFIFELLEEAVQAVSNNDISKLNNFFSEWEATLEYLSNKNLLERLQNGLHEVERGEVVSWDQFMK